jgi:hypothetical protein
MKTSIHAVIEEFGHLTLEDREYVAEVVQKQIIESKRGLIAKRAREAISNLKKGAVTRGTLKDLQRDMEND